MDKNAIKKYAVWARRELIERVSQRAMMYGITAQDAGDPNADNVNGHLLSQTEKRQRQALIRNIKTKGYEQVMEEVAYTWFNRFAALRFLEVNGYLPSHIRVFTNDSGEFKPQILSEAIHLEMDGLDMNKVYELESANKSEELFKYLLIVQCNALNSILPGMFQRIEDYTELLLPDHLLREGSVIEQMVTTIPEKDWTDQVQIIGWLYQYYNTEPKDKVFADLKKNIKITKENIPAATQLFTPDWIVHYMVENSLGRLWLEGHPNDSLKSEWKYYLDEAEQEPEIQAQLATIRKEYAALKPEEIRVIDPCMGSGHILCVLFDVLVRIYEDYGYTAREAAVIIVENNLWGLDIDERAAQLSYFAVMMKARQYDRRFFTRKVQPHVYAIEEWTGEIKNGWSAELKKLCNLLRDGKEYGSIITVPEMDWDSLRLEVERMDDAVDQLSFESISEENCRKLHDVINVGQAMGQRYNVVVTNPPYMGASNMNPKLSQFIKDNYADYKSDFFSAFMVHCSEMTVKEGYCSFFTPYVWMFIQSYEKLRNYMYENCTIETLIQFEYSAFEEATVPVCTLAFKNNHIPEKKGCYLRLTDFRGGMEIQRQKTLEAIADHECGFYFEQTTENFSEIPGAPMAYWNNFNNGNFKHTVGETFASGGRNKTHNDARYTRFHWEVIPCETKWRLYLNGGDFCKYYGNNTEVVLWTEKARSEYKSHGGLLKQSSIDSVGVYWGKITSSTVGFMYKEKGWIFSSVAPSLISKSQNDSLYLLAYLNSKVAQYYLRIINPTMTTNAGDVASLPYKDNVDKLKVIELVENNIDISHTDWDSFETSWAFQRHPLISQKGSVAEAYAHWETECNERFSQLKSNEEKLNRIFIDIYGLQDELTSEVENRDVSARMADLIRDIKSLISYAVGCMFGRYSLDVPGLAYAGGEWNAGKYHSFLPDRDAILPIMDDDYFTDDISSRFFEFVRIVYGEEMLEENLQFIARALGGKGSPREAIRNYFINGFYADHLKVYQKRPIYWLFDSGKKNGFKCLIYMHRYQPDTIARIRTDYVHEQQSRYRTAIADLEQRINGASTSERVKLSKKMAMLQAQAEELRVYEEKIHHLADQMIRIDLDDGVKHNYEIFKDVLAKIK